MLICFSFFFIILLVIAKLIIVMIMIICMLICCVAFLCCVVQRLQKFHDNHNNCSEHSLLYMHIIYMYIFVYCCMVGH